MPESEAVEPQATHTLPGVGTKDAARVSLTRVTLLLTPEMLAAIDREAQGFPDRAGEVRALLREALLARTLQRARAGKAEAALKRLQEGRSNFESYRVD